MASLLDNTRNYSFYAVPAAFAIAMAPHVYAFTTSKKSFDITHPRTLTEKLKEDQTLDAATKGRVTRAEGAQTNGFESLGFFASAVVAGNLAGLPAQTLNLLSGGYLASRVVYNLVYINNTTESMGNVRTLVWFAGIGQIATLFIKAGNLLIDRPANLI